MDEKFTDAELELLLEGLNELEVGLGSPMPPNLGFLAGESKEEVEAKLKESIEEARAEARLKRRAVILLKAKLVNMQAENEVARFFAPAA